jgi:hypothetical protein
MCKKRRTTMTDTVQCASNAPPKPTIPVTDHGTTLAAPRASDIEVLPSGAVNAVCGCCQDLFSIEP